MDHRIHVIQGWEITTLDLIAPTGEVLPTIDIAFMSRTGSPESEMDQWPVLRLPREIALKLVGELSTSLAVRAPEQGVTH